MKFPPLDALRYFEATARLSSFTLAADELCISQSAVSQKVNQLEDRLGYRLFDRKPRQLSLTDRGSLLYPKVHQALIQIHDAFQQVEYQQINLLDVYCMPSFAARWLMPILNDFHDKNKNISINITAELTEPNFNQEIVDVGICHGIGDQPQMMQLHLFKDYIYPVASPELFKKLQLNDLNNLKKATLLHDSLPQAKLSTSWNVWLTENNITGVNPNVGCRYNHADLIVRAAIDGQGVALARHVLVAEDIAQGRLIRLTDLITPDQSVYLVCLKKLVDKPQVASFIKWITQKAEEFESKYDIEKLKNRKPS